MQPDLFDDRLDGRLRVAQAEPAAVNPEAPRQDGEIEHQGRVAEDQAREIDYDITLGVDGTGECPAATSLRRPVLISSTTQYRGAVIELDDPGKLHNRDRPGKDTCTRLQVKPHIAVFAMTMAAMGAAIRTVWAR